MNICVVGTGYVGLVTGTCFAERGQSVTCVDVDEDKIRRLKQGESPIYEPGLSELLVSNSAAGRLKFTTSLTEGISGAEAVFIAVGTPSRPDGSADLKYVFGVVDQLAPVLPDGCIVVTKSTVPVGTGAQIRSRLTEAVAATGRGISFEVMSNPEFLKEGSAIADAMNPDRVVVGGGSAASIAKMRTLYSKFIKGDDQFLAVGLESAEMIKYASNAMLATRISFINEIADICEATGADVEDVAVGMGMDTRIGPKFLKCGIGYGGSCFPKDVAELMHLFERHGRPDSILKAVTEVNERRKVLLVDRLKRLFPEGLKGKKFAVWGLAFKPETDDIREAPSLKILPALIADGATVAAHDPEGMPNVRKTIGEQGIKYCGSRDETLSGADALLILTEWAVFKKPDWDLVKRELKRPLVLDGRNQFDPAEMSDRGIEYYCIGRGNAVS